MDPLVKLETQIEKCRVQGQRDAFVLRKKREFRRINNLFNEP